MILPSENVRLKYPHTTSKLTFKALRDKDLVGIYLNSAVPMNLSVIRFKIGTQVIMERTNVKEGDNILIDKFNTNIALPLYAAMYFEMTLEFVYDALTIQKESVEEDEYETIYTYNDELSEYRDVETNEIRAGYEAYPQKVKTGRKIVIPNVNVSWITRPEVRLEWNNTVHDPRAPCISVDIWQTCQWKGIDESKRRYIDEGRLLEINDEWVSFRNVLVFRSNTSGFKFSM